jgi:hypothetical protein
MTSWSACKVTSSKDRQIEAYSFGLTILGKLVWPNNNKKKRRRKMSLSRFNLPGTNTLAYSRGREDVK